MEVKTGLRVPTIDDAVTDHKPESDYKDWAEGNTRVLVYTDAPELYPRDRYAEDKEDARYLAGLIGRVLEVNEVPHRWFIRVPRTRSV